MKIDRIARKSRWLFVIGLAGCWIGCSSEGPTVTPTKEERAQTKEETRALHQELKAERKGGMRKKNGPTAASPETKPAPESAKAGSETPEK